MKKFIGMWLTVVIVFNISFIAYADNYTSLPQTSTQNVGVSFSKSSSNVISVNIEWGSLAYKYKSELEWDTSGMYVPVSGDTGEWVLADSSNNNENARIRITNNSDRTIYVDYNYTKSSDTGIPKAVDALFHQNYDFSDSGIGTASNINVDSLADSGTGINGNIFTRYISLSGKLTSIDNAAITNGLTVGTVTISIDTENDGGSND